jgi:hypothetical protein
LRTCTAAFGHVHEGDLRELVHPDSVHAIASKCMHTAYSDATPYGRNCAKKPLDRHHLRFGSQ